MTQSMSIEAIIDQECKRRDEIRELVTGRRRGRWLTGVRRDIARIASDYGHAQVDIGRALGGRSASAISRLIRGCHKETDK